MLKKKSYIKVGFHVKMLLSAWIFLYLIWSLIVKETWVLTVTPLQWTIKKQGNCEVISSKEWKKSSIKLIANQKTNKQTTQNHCQLHRIVIDNLTLQSVISSYN